MGGQPKCLDSLQSEIVHLRWQRSAIRKRGNFSHYEEVQAPAANELKRHNRGHPPCKLHGEKMNYSRPPPTYKSQNVVN